MNIAITCGGCAKTYDIEAKHEGRWLKCKKCGEAIQVARDGGERVIEAGVLAEEPVLAYRRVEGFVPWIAPVASVVTTLVLGWLVIGFMRTAWSSMWTIRTMPEMLRGAMSLVISVIAMGVSGLGIVLGRNVRRGGLGGVITVVTLCGLAMLTISIWMALMVPKILAFGRMGAATPAMGLMILVIVVYAAPLVMGLRVLKARKNAEGRRATEGQIAGCRVFEETFLEAMGIGILTVGLREAVGIVVASKYPYLVLPLAMSLGRFFYQYELIWVLGIALVSAMLMWRGWRAKGNGAAVGLGRICGRMAIVYGVIAVVLFAPVVIGVFKVR